ncbi:MAG: hypothetical protein K0R28_5317 [Paenibacillus sp.]|nr:hypothetical protein [Paenibacillus sp.]
MASFLPCKSFRPKNLSGLQAFLYYIEHGKERLLRKRTDRMPIRSHSRFPGIGRSASGSG